MIAILLAAALAADAGAPAYALQAADAALRALECAVAGATIEFSVEREPLVPATELAERWGIGAPLLVAERHRIALAGSRLATWCVIDSTAEGVASDVHEFAFDGVNVWFKRSDSNVAVVQPLAAFRVHVRQGRLLSAPYHDALGIRPPEHSGELGREAVSAVREACARGTATWRETGGSRSLLEVTVPEGGGRREWDLDPRLGYAAVATRAYRQEELLRETIHDDFVEFGASVLPRKITVVRYGRDGGLSAAVSDPILIERIRVTGIAPTAAGERYEVDVKAPDLCVLEGRVPGAGNSESGLFTYLQTPPAAEMLTRFRDGAPPRSTAVHAGRWIAAALGLAFVGLGFAIHVGRRLS